MSRTDLIADVFTIIRNGIMAKKDIVDIPSSNTISAILGILKNQQYIEDYKVIEDKKQGIARVHLKYTAGIAAIKNIKRISRPGLRVYVKRGEVPSVLKGRGIAIISTSKGIVTDSQARESGLGGEVIGYIW